METDLNFRYMLGLACDTRDFFRWQCPRCGQDFKTKVDPDATQDVLSDWAYRYLASEGVHSSDGAGRTTVQTACCPYCQFTAIRQDFLHPDVVQYVRHFAFREIVEPLVNEMIRGFASGFKSSKFLTVRTSFSEARAQRPLSGPEPADQVAVRCLACGETFTVYENWRGTVGCPSCSTTLLAQ